MCRFENDANQTTELGSVVNTDRLIDVVAKAAEDVKSRPACVLTAS